MRYIFPIFFFALIFSTYTLQAQDKNATYKKFERSIQLIEGQYVDSTDTEHLTTVAIKAMMKELDPHSKYMSKEVLRKSQENIRGNFSGVGINYQILHDTLLILKVVPNGPSHKAGLKAGDRLIRIEDSLVVGEHIRNSMFSKMLRGKKGSTVKVQVLRHKDRKLYDFDIKRGSIKIESLDAHFMLTDKVAYLKLRRFSQSTMQEFLAAMFTLKLQGMEHLILDLRGNPGGLMLAAIQMADEFLEEDKSIVYTKGLHYPHKNYPSSESGSMHKGRVIVLMNGRSASASEIIGGALQDNDRALIMGRRSYGKGLVGRNFYLPDGSGIRLTTGRYYTPAGRSIQKSYKNGEDSYHKDLAKRLSHGELFHPDSIHFPDSLKYQTVNGRTVYGGGGIMPDIFLPLDTTDRTSDYYEKLLKKGVINFYAGYYFDQHLEDLQARYPEYDIFKADFKWTEEIQQGLFDFAQKEYDIEPDPEGFKESEFYMVALFRAILARNLYTGGQYFEENSVTDQEIQKALEVIQSPKLFKERKIQHK